MNAEQKAFQRALRATWEELGKALELCPQGYGIKKEHLEPAMTHVDEAYVWFKQNHT